MDFRSLILSFAITIGFVSFSWAQSASPTWTGKIECSVRGDTLSLDFGRGGAYSVEGLKESTTGSVSYTLSGDQHYKSFGFTRPYSTFLHGNIDGHTMFYFYPWGATNYYINGVYKGATTAVLGDVFKIERIGSSGDVKFYKNGTVLKTVANGESSQLAAYAGFYSGGSPYFEGITIDFTDPSPGVTNAISNASADLTSLGGIDLTVSGNAPFTYNWSNSATTQDISSLGPGQYAVTVTDNNGMKAFQTYSVGHAVSWGHFMNAMSIGNSVTKTGADRTYGGAVTNEAMPANTDGWIEFSASAALEWKFFGLTTTPVLDVSNPSEPDFNFYFLDNGEAAVREKTAVKLTISYAPGDIFRIERVGSTGAIKYYKNGNLIYTSLTTQTDQMVGMAVLYNLASTFENVRATFAYPRPVLAFDVTNADSPTGKGGINVTVSSGTTPFLYSWSITGENIEDITDLFPGRHPLVVTDAQNLTAKNTVGLGIDVEWQSLANITVTGQTIEKTSPTYNWDAGALSGKIAEENEAVWLEFTAVQDDAFKFIGFQDDAYAGAPSTVNTLLYSFCIYPNGLAYAVVGASFKKKFTYVIGDILNIERTADGHVHYYKNAKEVYVTPGTSTQALKAQTILYTNIALFNNVRYSKQLDISITSSPEILGNDGSIDIQIEGGSGPYSILWQGEQLLSQGAFDSIILDLDTITGDSILQNIDFSQVTYNDYKTSLYRPNRSNLSSGQYTIKVIDGSGQSISKDIFLGKALQYESYTGVDLTPTGFTKTATTGWGNAVVEVDAQLADGADGWFTFSVPQLTGIAAIGWVESTVTTSSYTDIKYGFYADNGTMKVVENGTLAVETTPIALGDEFVLKRTGTTLEYLKNGTPFKTSTSAGGFTLKLRGLGHEASAGLDGLGVDGTLTNTNSSIYDWSHTACGFYQSGSIGVGQNYAKNTEATFLWSNGATTPEVYGLSTGTYTVTITDNTPPFTMSLVSSISLFNKVYWEEHQSTEAGATENSTLKKTANGNTGYGKANSRNNTDFFDPTNGMAIEDSYWAEFTIPDLTNLDYTVSFGLREEPSAHPIATIRIIHPQTNSNNGFALGYLNGSSNSMWGLLGQVSGGDKIKVELDPVTSNLIPYCPTIPLGGSFDANIIFSVNGTPMTAMGTTWGTNLFNNKCLDIFGSIEFDNTEIITATTNLPCEEISQYAKLKEKPDGSYYTIIDGRVHFNYIEEYVDSDGLLAYTIYDDYHNDVTANSGSITPANVAFGDNRFSLEVGALGAGYYLLEIENDKAEKSYLRFKI